MKKSLVVLFALSMLLCSQTTQAQTRFGPQLGYVAKGDGAIQLGGHAEIFFNDNISIQPAFNYYFILNKQSNVSYSYWSIDADGHYYFVSEGSAKIYGLLGLTYLHAALSLGVFFFRQ